LTNLHWNPNRNPKIILILPNTGKNAMTARRFE
jgi:hypothetical protein